MKRQVLHLIGSLRHGGSEGQAVQLVRLLHDSGRFGVHVACLDSSGPLREEIEALGISQISEFPLTSLYDGNAVRQLWRCSRLLRTRSIDLLQTHDFYTNVFGLAAGALARVPVRIGSRRETGGGNSALQKRVERAVYGTATAIVANAEAVRDRLASEAVPTAKVTVIHNAVDTYRLQARSKERGETLAGLGLAWCEQRPIVTMVANMHLAVKDHPTFLRAARRVKAEFPSAVFALAGEGNLRASIQALAVELGLADHAVFLGDIGDIAELLVASSVCVLSSRAEGFSNAILEYMAAGRPVVATDVGGAREAVVEGETGYLASPTDDVALAARIVSLLRDPKRARVMGECGRQVVEQRFSCQARLAKTEALYERLLRACGRLRSP